MNAIGIIAFIAGIIFLSVSISNRMSDAAAQPAKDRIEALERRVEALESR